MAVLLSAGVIAGCGSAKKSDPAPTADAPTTETPSEPPAPEAPPVVAAEAEPAAEEPNEADTVFQRWDAAFAGGSATSKAEWEALTADIKPQVIIDGLEYVTAFTRVTGKQQYTFSLLFRSTQDLTTNYHFAMDGYVAPSNLGALPEHAREKGVMKFHRRLNDDPTSKWKAGEYHVVDVKADAPRIPYNLLLLAFSPTEDTFWNHVGARLSLGWQWAAGSYEAMAKKVEGCATPADLYAIAPSGPQIPSAVEDAIAKKWASFEEGHTPKKLIDGLELVRADTVATGKREYTFSYLLKATADLQTDHIFTVIGEVDPSHLQHITPSKPGGSFASWHIDLKHAPMSLWKKGTYHVAQLKIETELIPYNVSLWLSPRGADGSWDWANRGIRVDLGWQADTRKEPSAEPPAE